jgi:hypothetical protein
MRWNFVPVVAAVLLLGGCASTDIKQFAGGEPKMAPDTWMFGTVDGYGLIVDRFGTVRSQFHAHEVGDLDAATHTVTVVEHIVYLQGSTDPAQDRTWHFVEQSPGHWTGTAADIIGTATGEQVGNAWHLKFRQTLGNLDVDVDDWRWRESDTVAIDHSTVSKLGITLATGEIAFVKSK